MTKIEEAIKHFKALQKRYTTQHNGKHCEYVSIALLALERDTPIKPMLMQVAEPEYMCECGQKFYAYYYKPNYCYWCGKKFDWSEYAFKEGGLE